MFIWSDTSITIMRRRRREEGGRNDGGRRRRRGRGEIPMKRFRVVELRGREGKRIIRENTFDGVSGGREEREGRGEGEVE